MLEKDIEYIFEQYYKDLEKSFKGDIPEEILDDYAKKKKQALSSQTIPEELKTFAKQLNNENISDDVPDEVIEFFIKIKKFGYILVFVNLVIFILLIVLSIDLAFIFIPIIFNGLYTIINQRLIKEK